jgi:hypothetical protein
MDNIYDIEGKARLFEEIVISTFNFLESELNMHRRKLRISNRNDLRDAAVSIRFESSSHRFEIAWGIGQDGLGILIYNKSCLETSTIYNKNCFVYFEPFLEFLTNGEAEPIVPQIYPKMSTNKIIKTMNERKKLFETSLAELIERLANKFKANFETIISKDITSYKEFHKWMDEHQ